MGLAVSPSSECFTIALDSKFLKGLSGVIVLGQVNRPRLEATLSKRGVAPYDVSDAFSPFDSGCR